ncbi:glycosyltransferase family 4 protein [soil metagenome]
MAAAHLQIGFVRRGYSASGGAEAYLKRLAQGVCAAGNAAQLFTTAEWPEDEWPFGRIMRVAGESPLRFADEVEKLRVAGACDILMSLERVWRCDVFRAGDGVHRAWLERRAQFSSPLQRFAQQVSGKHRAILQLEEALLRKGGAARVIANSRMVQEEIAATYGYPAARIEVVPNGVPVEQFRTSFTRREATRQQLQLSAEEIAVLFVGSGWERKGLRFAIEAVARCEDPRLRLLVAGRGNESKYGGASPAVRFLGVARDLPALYAAADLFLLPTIYDPFSNACLEALAAGLPVITTRANGFAEIITDGVHGSMIAAPDNVKATAEALRFWSGAEHRLTTRPQRLELAARYDISVNVARTLEILLQAASAASTSGKIRNT